MAKSKLSVSIDPDKLERAQSLVDAPSVSELLDIALTCLIESQQERNHVEGYLRCPVDHEFTDWSAIPRREIHDDVDWASLYGEKP